jgi:hypothetical protein
MVSPLTDSDASKRFRRTSNILELQDFEPVVTDGQSADSPNATTSRIRLRAVFLSELFSEIPPKQVTSTALARAFDARAPPFRA